LAGSADHVIGGTGAGIDVFGGGIETDVAANQRPVERTGRVGPGRCGRERDQVLRLHQAHTGHVLGRLQAHDDRPRPQDFDAVNVSSDADVAAIEVQRPGVQRRVMDKDVASREADATHLAVLAGGEIQPLHRRQLHVVEPGGAGGGSIRIAQPRADDQGRGHRAAVEHNTDVTPIVGADQRRRSGARARDGQIGPRVNALIGVGNTLGLDPA